MVTNFRKKPNMYPCSRNASFFLSVGWAFPRDGRAWSVHTETWMNVDKQANRQADLQTYWP